MKYIFHNKSKGSKDTVIVNYAPKCSTENVLQVNTEVQL